MPYVATAPANFSFSVFLPVITGIARQFSANSLYTPSMRIVISSASSAVACAVCPSCHKNSLVLKNGRVVFSHRITLHH